MRTPKEGLVSVIIPCFNQERFVREAVASALAQSHKPIEVVVVDDGSCRPIGGLLSEYPAKLIRQPNLGVSAARNAGFRASSGEFVIFLDADDRLLPNAAAVGVRTCRQNPTAAFAAGLCQVIDAAGKPAPFLQRGPLADEPYVELLRGNFIWMPGQALFRRAALPADPFDSTLDACADYDLYLRLARGSPVVVFDEVVADYREHDTSMSENAGLMLRTSLEALGRQHHLLSTPHERTAYREGRRFWREFYADHLVAQVRRALRRPGGLARAVAGGLTLLRYHPAAVFRQLIRKGRVIALGPKPGLPAEPRG